MNGSQQTAAPTEAAETGIHRAVFGDSPEILAAIYHDDVNMAVWQRSPTDGLITNPQLLTEQRFTNYNATVSASVLHELEDKLPKHAVYAKLKADIVLLADMFSCLFELESIGLRVTVLSEAMCPKFHVDRVPCRLITTYVGSGTQWLPHHCIDRSKLGAGSRGLSDADSGLYPAPASIQSLAAGDVALLKGESWLGNEGAGLVHRSPGIEAGQQRLLLTLDFASIG